MDYQISLYFPNEILKKIFENNNIILLLCKNIEFLYNKIQVKINRFMLDFNKYNNLKCLHIKNKYFERVEKNNLQ